VLALGDGEDEREGETEGEGDADRDGDNVGDDVGDEVGGVPVDLAVMLVECWRKTLKCAAPKVVSNPPPPLPSLYHQKPLPSPSAASKSV